MNAPNTETIERVFHDWAAGDCYVITHKIVEDANGRNWKREVSEDI